ncbi:Translocation protein S62 [Agyrium rufum]|nr:Translocation protein S62 [Agyrium rufum]
MASPQGPPPGQPGQPSPQQIAAMQQHIAMEAQKRGMTPQQYQQWQRQQIEAEAKKQGLSVEQYINKMRQEAFQNHQRQQQMMAQQQQQGGQPQGQPPQQGGPPPQQGQQVPINPGPPNPAAVALAKWLTGQDLKPRTCILNGQRKDMFRVKRALRAIESPAYAKAASKKNSLLPALTPQNPAPEIFKLLPLSLLALRVSKADPHEGHDHGPSKKPAKRTKGLWTVKIESQQDIRPDLHYVWLFEGSQWRTKLYAGGALLLIMAVVMFPLWPIKLRIGVWYLSMGMLGLLGLFFAMAIFRLILFCITVFTVPPGLWLYPNLFEDVGFFDSFRPAWGWQEDKKAKKTGKPGKSASKSKSEPPSANGDEKAIPTPSAPVSTSASLDSSGGTMSRRNLTPQIEEVEDGDSD